MEKFIGAKEYSDDQIAKLIEHTSVDKMRANPMVNGTGVIDVSQKRYLLWPQNSNSARIIQSLNSKYKIP